jgi:uncharacterized membrane protein HdeD (DUF308 family)
VIHHLADGPVQPSTAMPPQACLLGILSLVAGVLLIMHPDAGLAALTMLMICYFWIAGLFRVVTSLIDRYDNWGWDFAYGLCAIAIGFIALSSWPLSRFWLLGVLIGAELIARGVAMVAGSVAARQGLRMLKGQVAPT